MFVNAFLFVVGVKLLQLAAAAGNYCSGSTTCSSNSVKKDCGSNQDCWSCKLGCYCGDLATSPPPSHSSSPPAPPPDKCTKGGTFGYLISEVYTVFIDGKKVKSRVVSQPDTEDATKTFINTFVVPMGVSLVFLFGLIYAAKYISQLEAFKSVMEKMDQVAALAEGDVTKLSNIDFAGMVQKTLDDQQEKLETLGSDEAEDDDEPQVLGLAEEEEEKEEKEAEEKELRAGMKTWNFSAWQWVWVRLVGPLLTWCLFCVVTAAGAGKTTAILNAYQGSQDVISCIVYKTGNASLGTSDTWWENPYAPCALANGTLLYATDRSNKLTDSASGQTCKWGTLALDGANLKHAYSFGQWAYATPIISILVTIFILSGAFFMSDANKKNVSASAVSRKWKDVQTTIYWKTKEQRKCVDWLVPVHKIKTIDFYAVERVAMDHSMILYLPVALQNFIKKLQGSILSFLKEFGKDEPAELLALSKKPSGPIKEMNEDQQHFLSYYENNTPTAPPDAPAGADSSTKGKYAMAQAKYKRAKSQVEGGIKEYITLRDDLKKVAKTLRGRAAELQRHKNKPNADPRIVKALDLIITEFAEYSAQCVNPDPKKGQNILASIGPKTLLRAGIAGSPTEVPAQSLSLLLATITFANNYYCGAALDSVNANWTTPPSGGGCPPALISWATVQLGAINAYRGFSGPLFLAVAFSLINSIATIISKMAGQTKELIKRIKTRGQDIIEDVAEKSENPMHAASTSRQSGAPRGDNEHTHRDTIGQPMAAPASTRRASGVEMREIYGSNEDDAAGYDARFSITDESRPNSFSGSHQQLHGAHGAGSPLASQHGGAIYNARTSSGSGSGTLSMSGPRWFYLDERGVPQGPFDAPMLRSWFSTDEYGFSGETCVRAEHWRDFHPAGRVFPSARSPSDFFLDLPREPQTRQEESAQTLRLGETGHRASGSATASSYPSPSSRLEQIKAEIVAIYQKVNPQNLTRLDEIFADRASTEKDAESLLFDIRAKYALSPPVAPVAHSAPTAQPPRVSYVNAAIPYPARPSLEAARNSLEARPSLTNDFAHNSAALSLHAHKSAHQAHQAHEAQQQRHVAHVREPGTTTVRRIGAPTPAQVTEAKALPVEGLSRLPTRPTMVSGPAAQPAKKRIVIAKKI